VGLVDTMWPAVVTDYSHTGMKSAETA